MNEQQKKGNGHIFKGDCLNGTNVNAGCGVQGRAHTHGKASSHIGGGIGVMEPRSYLPDIFPEFFRPVHTLMWRTDLRYDDIRGGCPHAPHFC